MLWIVEFGAAARARLELLFAWEVSFEWGRTRRKECRVVGKEVRGRKRIPFRALEGNMILCLGEFDDDNDKLFQ